MQRSPLPRLLLLITLIPVGLPAQTNPPAELAVALPPDPSAELRLALEASDLAPEVRTPLEDALARAQTLQHRAQEYDRQLAELKRRIRDGAALQDGWAQRTAQLPPEQIDLPDPTATVALEPLETQLAQEKAFLDALPVADAVPADATIPAELATRIATLTAAVEQPLPEVPADAAAPTLSDRIQRWLAECQRRSHQSELAVLQYTLDHQAELDALAAAERQFRARELRVRAGRVAQLQEWLQRARSALSSQVRISAEEAELAADRLPARLREFAQATAELGRELERITDEEIATHRRTEDLKTRQAEMKQERDVLRRRFEAVGASPALGKLLVQHWVHITDRSWFRETGLDNRQRVAEIINRRLDLEAEAQDPALRESLEGFVRAQADAPADDPALAAMVDARVNVVEALAAAYRRLDTAIAQLQIAGKAARDEARQLTESVEQWLMWTPTGPTLTLAEVLRWPGMVIRHFQVILRELTARASAVGPVRRAAFLLGVAVLLLGVSARRRITRRLAELDRRVGRIRTDRFVYTLEALLWTAVRALPLPGLLFLLGFVLSDDPATMWFHGLSGPLHGTAATLFYLTFLNESARPGALGPRHLRWSRTACELLRSELRWFIPVFVSLQLVGSLTAILTQGFAEPVMRLYLLLLIGGSAVFALRLLRTGSPWHKEEAASPRPSVFVRWQVMWKGLVLVLTVALAYLFVLGHGFAAARFVQMAVYSQFIAVGIVYLRELCLRAVSVPERRLRFQQQVQKRLEARRQDQSAEEPAELLDIEEPEIDFSHLGGKARRLINGIMLLLAVLALGRLWTEYLPVVNALDKVALPINKTILVSGQEQAAPLTLGDLVTALVIGFVVAVAATNLPALVEITLLQQLPMDQGVRFAIVTLLQYAIAGVGVVAVFTHLGFSWSSIRWLAAALSVGVGFGLQEIVANFISGIIILFERPIRVGDVVTMGDTTGVVSRIRIRATTVVNWDKQELLIPNKEFITGRLLNWTLTDKLTRIVIPIGVAYGTDTRRALKVAREIVETHPQVLAEPKPLFTFEGFGDSSLQLVVRCYLASLEYRLDTITELHTRIHERFLAEGIEIAFPQLDVHLKPPPPTPPAP